MNELLRILLCIIIIIGHTEGGDGFFYPATATIAFMMLSGYSSEISLQSGKFKSFKSYIYDRLIRLFPLYLLIAVSTLLITILLGAAEYKLSVLNLFLNFSFVSINFAWLFPSLYGIVPKSGAILVPQAWFLALLIQYYALYWGIRKIRYLNGFVALFSFLVFLGGAFHLLPTLSFIYLLLPGTYCSFFIGQELAQAIHFKKTNHLISLIMWVTLQLITLLVLWRYFQTLLNTTHIKEVFAGNLIGPFLLFVFRWKIKATPFTKYLGKITFPLYMIHFQIIWLINLLQSKNMLPQLLWIRIVIVVLLSFLFSVLIEKYFTRPIENLRYSVRKRKN